MMAKLANTATTSTPQSQSSPAIHNHSLQTHNHDSIDNLRKLSAFKCCFTEQHQYIDSVRSTIHSALPPLTTNTPLLPASWESDPSEEEEEADKAALAWTSRLIVEGGVRKASKMDARGLLLLIGCFGILGGFRNEDIRDLLQVSAISKISGALRRSNVLVPKIPDTDSCCWDMHFPPTLSKRRKLLGAESV